MQHLEEGTIHAWLDGELSPEECARIESHVAACGACAALVAEARGLIAASSRILSALDDVPGGVIPEAGKSPEDPPLARPGLTLEHEPHAPAVQGVARARRPFYRHPQFAAAAAVVLMVVGTWTVWQRSMDRPALAPTEATREAVAVPAPQRMDSAALSGVTAPEAAPSEVRSAKTLADEAGRAAASSGGAAAARDARGANAPATSRFAAGAPAGAAPARQRLAERDAIQRSDASNEAMVPPAAPTPQAALAQKAAKDSAGKREPERKQLAVSPDSVVAREEARIRGEVAAQRQMPDSVRLRRKFGDAPASLSPVVVTGAAAALADATLGASIAVVNACYDLTRTSAALENRVPARIQLLGTRGPTIAQRVLNEIAVLGADPDTGEWFWWVRGDRALMLVRVEDNVVRYEVPVSGVGAVDAKAVMRPCREE
jgi:hypothetical protein